MMEAMIPLGVALSTGFSVLISKLHSRIGELDKRIDTVELRVATDYLSKQEFSGALERVEAHRVRIEDKIDKLANTKCD